MHTDHEACRVLQWEAEHHLAAVCQAQDFWCVTTFGIFDVSHVPHRYRLSQLSHFFVTFLSLEAYESEVDQILKDANAKVRRLAEARAACKAISAG